jgi:hypothetical protein
MSLHIATFLPSLCPLYVDYTAFHFDGQFLQVSIGYAILYEGHVFSYRLRNLNDTCTAELYAVQATEVFSVLVYVNLGIAISFVKTP